MKGKKIAAFVAVLYIIVLVLCSSTFFWQGAVPELFAKLSKTQVFEEGVLKTTSRDVSIALHQGETALLEGFTQLKSADFSGSEDLEEVLDWAQKHPQVEVRYLLSLPDGKSVYNTEAHVDLSGMGSGNFEAYLSCLRHLVNIQEAELGRAMENPAPLSAQQLSRLMSAFPDVRFNYELEIMGESRSIYTEALDLSGLAREQLDETVENLGFLTGLKTVELGDESESALEWEDIARLTEACPNARFNYSFELYGKSFTLADESIDISYITVEDNGEAVRAALRCMKNCKELNMDCCYVPNDKMAEIRDEFPDVEVIWRVFFGDYYGVRTNEERILASKPSDGGMLYNENIAVLQYCTKVKYLDLGHNELISDISFVSHMPELEVFIIAMNPLTDLSPLADCPKLEYLELNTTHINDLSPLANSKALRHLNISCCYNLTDISPIYGLTELERLWIGNQTPIPAQQVQQMQQAAPNCKISTVSQDPHGDYWRELSYDVNTGVSVYQERYKLLRQQMGYYYNEYSFYWLDPSCKLPAPPHLAGKYYIHEDLLNGVAEQYGLS